MQTGSILAKSLSSSTSFMLKIIKTVSKGLIRDFKIQRWRRQRGRQKSNTFNNQNNNFARASRFFVHFFAVTARLLRENA